MNISSRTIFCGLLVFISTSVAVAQKRLDTATIGSDEHGNAIVRVRLLKTTPSAAPTGGLFVVPQDGAVELLTTTITGMSADFLTFDFAFPKAAGFDPKKTYIVGLLVPTNANGVSKTVRLDLSASSMFTLSLSRSQLGVPITCGKGIRLNVETALPDKWAALFHQLDELEKHPRDFAKVGIRVHGLDDSPQPFDLKSVTELDRAQAVGNGSLTICLLTEKPLPIGTLDVFVTFPTNQPNDFPREVSNKNFPGTSAAEAPKDAEPGSPEKRLIKQKLDLGLSLTSSVSDEEQPATATTPKTVKRVRTTRGVADLRYAPFFDCGWCRPNVIEDNKWMHFFDPIFINANVATGKITKDTLSLNRVLIGFEGQFRRRVVDDNLHKIVTHRLIYGGTHASDRDFKQDEFTGKFEYAPIFWDLNKPISLNYTAESGEARSKPYGYTFLPKVGFEIGRTYHRRNPASALTASPNVRRFYFGLDASFDITPFLTITVSDIAYVRGETPDHRFRNYFSGGVEAPMGRLFGSAVHSLFFSFEKGDQAPFATPAVNAIKLGYRVQY
jgi:hypothetical protein